MAKATPRQPRADPYALDNQLRINVDTALIVEIERTGTICRRKESEVIRAALKLGLASLRANPGLVPLLQPGVLRESPE